MNQIGHTLTQEEQEEVMELYFNWVQDNHFDGQNVPFERFESWFVLLGARIVKAKEQSSGFTVDTDIGSSTEEKIVSNSSCLVQ
jgi:hypothetical protein